MPSRLREQWRTQGFDQTVVFAIVAVPVVGGSPIGAVVTVDIAVRSEEVVVTVVGRVAVGCEPRVSVGSLREKRVITR